MALNWINPTSDGRPSPLPNETFLMTAPTADVDLVIPHTISGPKRSEKGYGTVWITDRRLVYLTGARVDDKGTSAEGTAPPPSFQSLSLPYHLISSASFTQGIFSSNALVISFKPVPGEASNLPDPGRDQHLQVKITLRDGQLWPLRQKLEEARSAEFESRRREARGEDLPAYHKVSSLAL